MQLAEVTKKKFGEDAPAPRITDRRPKAIQRSEVRIANGTAKVIAADNGKLLQVLKLNDKGQWRVDPRPTWNAKSPEEAVAIEESIAKVANDVKDRIVNGEYKTAMAAYMALGGKIFQLVQQHQASTSGPTSRPEQR